MEYNESCRCWILSSHLVHDGVSLDLHQIRLNNVSVGVFFLKTGVFAAHACIQRAFVLV